MPSVYGGDGKVSWPSASTEQWLVAIHVRLEILSRQGRILLGNGASGSSSVSGTERYPVQVRIPLVEE